MIQEQKQSTYREADIQGNPRKTMEPYFGRFYH